MVDDVISAISTVGFPIAAYLLFYFDLKQVVKENTLAVRELRDALHQKNG